MEYESSRIIDSNGQKYRVGWDEHGWFSIEAVFKDPESGEWYSEGGKAPPSFSPNGAEELMEAIEEGL